MYRRGDQREAPAVMNELLDRIRRLEETASRRALPPGYEYTVSGGQLTVVRTSDGAQAVIL